MSNRKKGKGSSWKKIKTAGIVILAMAALGGILEIFEEVPRETAAMALGLVLGGALLGCILFGLLRKHAASRREPVEFEDNWLPRASSINVSGGMPTASAPAPDQKEPPEEDCLDAEIARKRQELMLLDEELLYQSFGLYRPKYAFSTVDGYKELLEKNRKAQKQMIKDRRACIVPSTLMYNNSIAEGAKVGADWAKLMLRAFNGECDAIIAKAKFNNLEQLEKRIRRSAEEISKIGCRMNITIELKYVQLKVDELHIAYEYEVFKQQEKERLRAIREEEREKAKAEKELAAARAKVEKDRQHVRTEMDTLRSKAEASVDAEKESLLRRIAELEAAMAELDSELENIEERSANARAGYVYVISNIGSFGDDVYKIGMTRRLEPQERVDELGDASVPFRFDVHAFIFSTDAVALETALHHRFDDRRVNMVNTRKEFFRVSLDEIEREVKANHSEVVEFTRTTAAQEYRETLKILESRRQAA